MERRRTFAPFWIAVIALFVLLALGLAASAQQPPGGLLSSVPGAVRPTVRLAGVAARLFSPDAALGLSSLSFPTPLDAMTLARVLAGGV